MPSAVPGAGAISEMMPTLSRPSRPMNPTGPGGFPSPLLNPGSDPASQQYEVVNQEDGSMLLHVKNADGSLGPVVKIINPIKPIKPVKR